MPAASLRTFLGDRAGVTGSASTGAVPAQAVEGGMLRSWLRTARRRDELNARASRVRAESYALVREVARPLVDAAWLGWSGRARRPPMTRWPTGRWRLCPRTTRPRRARCSQPSCRDPAAWPAGQLARGGRRQGGELAG